MGIGQSQPQYLNELDSKQCKIVFESNETGLRKFGYIKCSDGRKYIAYLGPQTSDIRTGKLMEYNKGWKKLIRNMQNNIYYNLVLIRNQ